MLEQTKLFSGNNMLQQSFGRLNSEIAILIQQRYAEYDADMTIASSESFTNCVDEFLASFCDAVDGCYSELSHIMNRIKRRLRTTLLNFREYVARGIWLLKHSPDCKEQIEDMYFIPDTFDIDGLRGLISDIGASACLEDHIDSMQQRDFLRSMRLSLKESLGEILSIIDRDQQVKSFTVRRWVVKFKNDIRSMRSCFEPEWDEMASSIDGESAYEALVQFRDDALNDLESSVFYIDNCDDTNALVRNIHKLQGKCCGRELDDFLKNWALVEYLNEKIEELEADDEQAEEVLMEPAELFTDEAMAMWEKLQLRGFVDENFQPIITRSNSIAKFAVIASIMGGMLDLNPLWVNFETLWQIDDLTNRFCQAQNAKYYPTFYKDIQALLTAA